jgi:MOSC domain-containing protein YiiM
MLTFDELEAFYQLFPVAPTQSGRVRLCVLRLGGGRHEVADSVQVSPTEGVVGDRWSQGENRDPTCQITLMEYRIAELVADGERPLHTPGDNFLVDLDLSEASLPAGTRLSIGSSLLEVTATPHLGCAKFRARFGPQALKWVNWRPHRPRRSRGVNCRVIEAGTISVGDVIEVQRP